MQQRLVKPTPGSGYTSLDKTEIEERAVACRGRERLKLYAQQTAIIKSIVGITKTSLQVKWREEKNEAIANHKPYYKWK